MALELILYFLAGSLVLYFTGGKEQLGWKKAILTILLWPFVLLLIYVKLIDQAKKNNRYHK